MINEETRAKVIELNSQNKSLREIAATLSIGKSSVSAILKKAQQLQETQETQSQETQSQETQSQVQEPPKIIISEEIKPMDSANFMNSILSDVAPPSKTDDAFLDSFIKDLGDQKPVKSRGRPSKKAVDNPFFAAPSVAPQAVATFVPVADKGELIAKISLNVATFPDMLKDILKPSRDEFIAGLPKKSQGELSSLLSMIEYQRSITNTANVMKSMTVTGAALVEMGTKKFLRMHTDGFADMLRQDPSLDAIMREIAMENNNGIISKYQSPTVRLTALVITTLMAVDGRNRSRGQTDKNIFTVPVASDLEEKYNDM